MSRRKCCWSGSGREGSDMLPDTLLNDYAEKFFGFGSWNARIWFVGIEEAGGWEKKDVKNRLDAWEHRGRLDLEDAPSFYPASGNDRWHGAAPVLQATWKQLIRILLVARGKPDSDDAILDYQRHHLGRAKGREYLAELLPLPSPSSTTWNYRDWSDLPWLQSRSHYQNHVLLGRAHSLQQKLEQSRPRVVIFYASSWHRIWGIIARGAWTQAIQGQLMGMERNGTSFYVTRHPRTETDAYFRKIGSFLRERHGRQERHGRGL